MKNILFFIITLCILTSVSVDAQNLVFKQGNVNVRAGVGLVPTYLADNASLNV